MTNTKSELREARSIAIARVCIFLALAGFFPAQAGSIDGIYAFGDSLTDVGNIYTATGGAAPANRQVAAGGSLPYSSTTQIGWTAGAGVEVALAQNWSAKGEYLYVDLGNQTCPVASCVVASSVPLTENIIRAGINYKFNY